MISNIFFIMEMENKNINLLELMICCKIAENKV